MASGCADEQPTGPKLARVSLIDNASFNKFFIAWSQSYSSGPIQTQTFALDARQERQYADLWPDQSVLSFASANPGRLYIVGDEPDQWCIAASEYADIYHGFVDAVRRTDPTARFSPAGFAEPNWHCCPPPEEEPCLSSIHATGYADQFYNAYLQRYGVAPPVNEWRFHDLANSFTTGDMNGWWSRVDKAAAWSVAHGAKMVLGAWGFNGWRESDSAFQEHLKQAIGRIMNDKRIVGAAYWSHGPWVHSPHFLVNDDGSLTPEGQTHVNPLTDIPADVKIARSPNGQASLLWNNTSSAWAAEVEFWVQAPGSNSFVYQSTQLVAGPGGTQTPFVAFKIGDSVRGRVRYSNLYGQAEWSSFSNIAVIASAESGADNKQVFRKRPFSCFLPFC
jgi:hypothetical protein